MDFRANQQQTYLNDDCIVLKLFVLYMFKKSCQIFIVILKSLVTHIYSL